MKQSLVTVLDILTKILCYAWGRGEGVKHSILCFTLKCSMLYSHYAMLYPTPQKCSIVRVKCSIVRVKCSIDLMRVKRSMLCFTPLKHSVVLVTLQFSIVF